ncbi:hypothetical protein R1sor_021485 [Riccia sorocarpa]|uniref:Uncharacterized protein n=1 Tax=Riccia sorocarpa TaxID=122646 RepID=A0ABD3GMW9_9MARC
MSFQPPSEAKPEKCVKVMAQRSRSLKRVLYLECGKDFADILLSLLVMPVGAILKVLEEAGSSRHIDSGLRKLYISLWELESLTFCVDKKDLIDPCAPFKSNGYLSLTSSVRYTCVNPSCQNAVSYVHQLCDTCSIGPAIFKCTSCSQRENHYVNNKTECSNCDKAVQRTHPVLHLVQAALTSSQPLSEVFEPFFQTSPVELEGFDPLRAGLNTLSAYLCLSFC